MTPPAPATPPDPPVFWALGLPGRLLGSMFSCQLCDVSCQLCDVSCVTRCDAHVSCAMSVVRCQLCDVSCAMSVAMRSCFALQSVCRSAAVPVAVAAMASAAQPVDLTEFEVPVPGPFGGPALAPPNGAPPSRMPRCGEWMVLHSAQEALGRTEKVG